MSYPQKIVTCCYCGTRAALVLTGKTRHELSCASCGAPLHDLKMLPVKRASPQDSFKRASPRDTVKRHPAKPARPAAPPRPRKSSGRRRKGLLGKVFDEAFDLIEDIFD